MRALVFYHCGLCSNQGLGIEGGGGGGWAGREWGERHHLWVQCVVDFSPLVQEDKTNTFK